MAIFTFILTLLTLLLGFIGLVVLIYGFKNNHVKNIVKGTVIFCIAILLFTIMSFKLTKVLIGHYKQKVHSVGVMLSEKECDSPFKIKHDMLKKCCPGKEGEMEITDTIITCKKICEKKK